MKEADARSKLCPLISLKCQGSNCMAWIKIKDSESSIKKGYCVKLQETEEKIVGIKRGAFNPASYERFKKNHFFEFNGSKDDFIILNKNKE